MSCYDQIINNTITSDKICYTCGIFCEFGLFVFSLLVSLCCINICCKRKKQYKEIINPQSPPPYV